MSKLIFYIIAEYTQKPQIGNDMKKPAMHEHGVENINICFGIGDTELRRDEGILIYKRVRVRHRKLHIEHVYVNCDNKIIDKRNRSFWR